MRNRSPVTTNSYFKCKVKVYDVAKKELIGEFESQREAAKFLGVKSVRSYIKTKGKCHKNKLGITVAIR